MQIKDLTFSQLKELRNEIVLNSLFIRDYNNSLGVDIKEVENFFDGYVDYLYEVATEDGWADNDFFEVMSDYDNDNNLFNYFIFIK